MRPLAEILDDVEGFLTKYVVLETNQLVAGSLWIAHTWVLEAAEVTPYLAITSPERCTGKSRLLEVLACLVRSPISTTNISPSALFRAIDAGPATCCSMRWTRSSAAVRGTKTSGRS